MRTKTLRQLSNRPSKMLNGPVALLLGLTALLCLAPGCVEEAPDERILRLAERLQSSLQTLSFHAEETLTFYPEESEPVEVSFHLVHREETVLRLQGISSARQESGWRPGPSEQTEPGTGAGIYLETEPFKIRDAMALAKNYRFEEKDRSYHWDGRPAWKIHLTPKSPSGSSYALVIDRETGLALRSIAFDSEGRRTRARRLKDLTFVDEFRREIHHQLNLKAAGNRKRQERHQQTVLSNLEQARDIVPEFELPAGLPSGYTLVEMREFVDKESVHGVICEFTDGVNPLLVYARPFRNTADLEPILGHSSGASESENVAQGGSGVEHPLPTDERGPTALVLVDKNREMGFYDYRLIASPVAIQVLTIVPQNEILPLFQALPSR